MAVSQVYRFLWITGIVFGSFPHINLGLLSDYKICGGSGCESQMSRVQAIRDHQGKDCRFLSFKQGDTIFVYHKLTGKREDLWAGSIDKRFGYFPKDAVQEEEVLATMEKVVETQKSDFFCVDAFGYPIDSSDVDSDDENDDQKIQIQESESTQTVPYTADTSTESPSTSIDPSTEIPVSAQQSDGTTTTEGDENKNAGDAAAGTHEEAEENPAALNEQGGSPSSSWLGSSVTGWLGLGKGEESGNLAEEEKEDEREETQAKTSLTSSVTGWLGFGGDGKPDGAVNSGEDSKKTADSLTSSVTGWLGFGGDDKPDDAVNTGEDSKKTADSLTSTMTGWLGFGGETKADSATNEQDGQRKMEEENEMKVTYRSRRMSLELEGSQLHEEEKKEVGTLDWLGNGLSHTLGFGNNNQESGQETSADRESEETIEEEKEQSASSSWFGIRDILGFRKDDSEADERTGSGFKETEEDKTLEHRTGSENVDTSQTQPAQTKEDKTEPHIQRLEEKLDTNKSDVEEQEQVPQSETGAESATLALVEDNSNNNTDASDGSKGDVLPADAASKVVQDDVSPQTKLEEKSQAVGEMSMTDEERSAEMKADGHRISSTGNEGEDNNTEPGEEEIKTVSDTDRNSDFTGQSVVKTDTDEKDQLQSNKTESGDEEGAEIMSAENGVSGDDHGGMRDREGSNEDTGVLPRETSTTQTESAEQSQGSGNTEESSGKSSSSGPAEERNEPVHSEDETAHSVKTDADSSDTRAAADNNTETEAHHGELGDKSKTLVENSGDQEPLSPQVEQRVTNTEGDTDKLKETEKNTENNLQQVQTEKATLGLEKDISTEGGLKAAVGSEKETEAEESKEEEKQEKTEAKQDGKQDQLKEEEGIQEEEKQQEVEEAKQQEKQHEAEELREQEEQQEVKEIQEEGKQEEVEELKEDKRQVESRKVEEIKEMEKQGEMEEIKEKDVEESTKEENQERTEAKQDGKQDELKEVEEIQEEEKQQEVKEIQEEGRQGEEEEFKEEKRQDDLKEVEEIKAEKTQEENEIKENDAEESKKEAKQDGKQDEVREVEERQGEEKQQEVEEEKQEKMQDEGEELKEKEKQQGVKEIQEEMEQIKEDKRWGELKEVEEIMVQKRQEEMGEIKENEKGEEVELLKDKEKQEKVEELKEEKKDRVEEAKEEKKQEEVEGLKGETKQERIEEIKGEQEEASHSVVQIENTQDEISRSESEQSETETQDENIKTEKTHTQEEKREKEEKKQGKVDEVEEEKKEAEELQQVDDVQDDRRDKEEDEGSKCLNELCPQAIDDESVRDRDENVSEEGSSSADGRTIQTGSKNDAILPDGTGNIQIVPSEGTEGDRIRQEEDGLEVDQTKDTDLPYSGENGHQGLPNKDQTGSNIQHEDTETSSSGISAEKKTEQTPSNHKTDTEDIKVTKSEDGDSQMKINDDNTVGSESWTEGGQELSATPNESVDSQAVMSEQVGPRVSEDPPGPSPSSDDRSKIAAETENGGAFGLFKNAFGFFSQTPVAETKDPTESAPSLDANAGETSQPQASLNPEPDLDSSSESGQVYEQDFPATTPAEQPQHSPPSADIQTSAPSTSHPHTPSPNPETAIQTKTISKHYKNLLAYMSVDEVTLLMELFGRHKLQFLDYMLGSSGTATEDPDNDESILSDIERLLHYQRETLVAATDAPQDDKEKTRTLTALQQLEMLITRVRETFNTRKSDTSKGNHQAEASCVGASCPTHSKDHRMSTEEDSSAIEDPSVGLDNSQRDEGTDVESDGQKRGKERETADEKIEEKDEEGVIRQILDFAHQIAEESAIHLHAVRELLVWMTVQVSVISRY